MSLCDFSILVRASDASALLRADRVADVQRDASRSGTRCEKTSPSRVPYRPLQLADDRRRELRRIRVADQLRAAEAGRVVIEAQVEVGQRLVPEVLQVVVGDLEPLARRDEVRPLVERARHRGVHVHGLQLERRRVGRLKLHRPEVWRLRVEDERAQLVLGLPD